MIGDAIGREKQLKGGSRKTKIDLIEKFNPEWNDLLSEVQDIMAVLTINGRLRRASQ